MSAIDHARLESAIVTILKAVGEDPSRPELARTPERAAKMLEELLGGIRIDPREYLMDPLPEEQHDLVVVRDIGVHSLCEHHLVPMLGVVHIGYLPSGRIVGFDRLARLVDGYARRPQIQERLTAQIADAIAEVLQPIGVAVVMDLEQFCMKIRGTRQTRSRVVTSAYRGAFSEDRALRAEFLSLVRPTTEERV